MSRATRKSVLTNPFRLLELNHLAVVLTFLVYHTGLPEDVSIQECVETTARKEIVHSNLPTIFF